jgi:hypothetical protein
MKYLQQNANNSLAMKILLAIAETSAKRESPVRLADIASAMYGSAEKAKQDIVRIMLDKTLVRCGIVEKIKFGARNVGYFLAAYRFQGVQALETEHGRVTKRMGTLYTIPYEYWPIPEEYHLLKALWVGYESARAKLETDFKNGRVSASTFESEKSRIEEERVAIGERLRAFKPIEEAVSG